MGGGVLHQSSFSASTLMLGWHKGHPIIPKDSLLGYPAQPCNSRKEGWLSKYVGHPYCHATSHSGPLVSHGEYANRTDGQKDWHQTVALCFLLDVVTSVWALPNSIDKFCYVADKLNPAVITKVKSTCMYHVFLYDGWWGCTGSDGGPKVSKQLIHIHLKKLSLKWWVCACHVPCYFTY